MQTHYHHGRPATATPDEVSPDLVRRALTASVIDAHEPTPSRVLARRPAGPPLQSGHRPNRRRWPVVAGVVAAASLTIGVAAGVGRTSRADLEPRESPIVDASPIVVNPTSGAAPRPGSPDGGAAVPRTADRAPVDGGAVLRPGRPDGFVELAEAQVGGSPGPSCRELTGPC